MEALHQVLQQLRYALRALLRRPVLAVVALTTLALGIGATTAIFSIINVVLLRPLPFAEPERLVMVWSTAPGQGLTEGLSSYPDFSDWREGSTAFADIAAFWTFPNGDVNLSGGSEPTRVSVARITPGFFHALGVQPLHGREFQKEESVVGNHRRAILSFGLWRDQFGADPGLVGKSVLVNGFPYTVVGVMPRELSARSVHLLGTDVQIWRPLVPEDGQTGGRDARRLHVVGRLAPNVTPRQAEAELAGIAQRLARVYPESNRETGVGVTPLRERVVRDVRRGLLFLLGAVGVVMLGACANVANLLLIKAAATRKEVAVQSALGASRTRLIAQMLTESLLLGGLGTVLGIGLAYAGIKAFVAIGPPEIPLLADARIDGPVLAFAVAAMLLTVILVGVLPAVRSTRPDASAVLRQSATRVLRVDDRRLMRALSVAQIALAMVLLTTGGLLVRSFQALLRVDPGFRTDRILSFQLELPMGAGMPYAEQDRRDFFFATLRHELSGLPGVRGTTIASAPPMEEEPSAIPLTLSGSADDRSFRANFRMVAHDYFGLLGIPLLRGRLLAPGDVRSGPPVVVVSASLARTIWGNADPIGQRLARSGSEADAEVVGVVGDVRTSGLDGEAARIVYVPASQGQYNFATLLVRTTNDPAALVPAVRHLAKNLDASLPLHRVRTLDSILAESVAQQRFQLLVIGTISLLMFALAVIGTYGVSAYGVSERTNELGIRAALGATTSDIRRLVLGEGARMTLLGIGIGTLITIALNRALTRFVFGISSLDVVAFLTAPALLALAALIAIAIPANRASRADPMQALKSE